MASLLIKEPEKDFALYRVWRGVGGGGGVWKFVLPLEKSWLRPRKLLRYLRISRKLEISQNAKSCSKYEKLPKSCLAACGKP